jgi:hypothetical protein
VAFAMFPPQEPVSYSQDWVCQHLSEWKLTGGREIWAVDLVYRCVQICVEFRIESGHELIVRQSRVIIRKLN